MGATSKHVNAAIASTGDGSGRTDRERLFRSVCDVLLRSGYGLTRREAEVCASIALGSKVAGTGCRLNISPHTVATHRKRAYSKLGIGSQNELFARYFESLCAVHLA